MCCMPRIQLVKISLFVHGVISLYFCSFADLQKPQIELDGKACAAVGQSGLMALYDTMFSQVIFWIYTCSNT